MVWAMLNTHTASNRVSCFTHLYVLKLTTEEFHYLDSKGLGKVIVGNLPCILGGPSKAMGLQNSEFGPDQRLHVRSRGRPECRKALVDVCCWLYQGLHLPYKVRLKGMASSGLCGW